MRVCAYSFVYTLSSGVKYNWYAFILSQTNMLSLIYELSKYEKS